MILRKIKMNKRADFTSLMIGIVIIFGLALALIIFAKVFLLFTTELKGTGKFSDRTVSTIELVEEKTIPLLDFFLFFSLISLMIGLIVSSIFINTHPVMTVIFIVALIIAVFVAGILSNIYTEVAGEDALAATAAEFVYTDFLFDNFAMVILVLGIILVVVLFGKSGKVSEVPA